MPNITNSSTKRQKSYRDEAMNSSKEKPLFCEKLIPTSPCSKGDSKIVEGTSCWSELPAELKNSLSFSKACEKSKNEKHWVLVNIQKDDEFGSHQLNWHVWSSEAIMEMLKMSFEFWQRYNTDPEAVEFCNLYNVTSFPHISLIDPRTRQKVMQWKPKLFIDPCVAASEHEPIIPMNVKIPQRLRTSDRNNDTTDSKIAVTSTTKFTIKKPAQIDLKNSNENSLQKHNEIPQNQKNEKVGTQESPTKKLKTQLENSQKSSEQPPAAAAPRLTHSYSDTNDVLRDLYKERLARMSKQN